MKYRIDAPISLDAPQRWDVVKIEVDFIECSCFTEALAWKIYDILEAAASDGGE